MGLSIEQVAKIAHNTCMEYALAIGEVMLEWEAAPTWQKESCINGVKFHLAHPHAGPDASHNNWLEHKRADGWVWGPVKDTDKKEHPCFLPYAQLPDSQKVKDWLFKGVVTAIAAEGQVDVSYREI